MCGFTGVVSNRPLAPQRREEIHAASDRIVHRGPDDSGTEGDKFLEFAFRRLSIIDLQGGHQPMRTPDGRYLLVFNGEIYNHHDLKVELEAEGIRFRTTSDSEVLLHLLARSGPEAIQRLNGMFAFAFWDSKTRSLLLGRDRLGIKPLYTAAANGTLWFGSEMRCFSAIPGIDRSLDMDALDEFLAIRYVVAPRTLWKGVRKLPPGCCAHWRDGELRVERYWDLPMPGSRGTLSDEEACERLRDLLDDATRLRLIADVPVGIMLSGGLDSTIIATLASRHTNSALKTFSIASSGGGDWDERQYARLVADLLGTDHYEMEVDAGDYIESLRRFPGEIDDLVADPASILLSHLSALARTKVTVALSGEGSDELMAGYTYHVDCEGWERQRKFNRAPGWLVAPFRALAPEGGRLQRYLNNHGHGAAQYAQSVYGPAGRGIPSDRRRRLAAIRHRDKIGHPRSAMFGHAYRGLEDQDFVTAALVADTRTWLPDNLLTKADRMSMLHSLELRVPFLDHRLVEFISSLPPEMKLRRMPDGGWQTKSILRRAFRDDIPREIEARPKQGFSLNWKEMITNEGRALVDEAFHTPRMRELFELSELEALAAEAQPGDHWQCQALLSLTLFSLWADTHL